MKKILSLLLAIIFVFLIGCSSDKNTSEVYSEISSDVSSKNDIASDISSDVTDVKTDIPEPTYKNLLTGLEMTQGGANKRPVAVMVNNLVDALPQYGIDKADIIYEIPVEGDITRLMAMYGDISDVPDVCSVRSARYYYPILALGYDAIYVHWGQDEITAAPTMANLGVDNINGYYGLCGRDEYRLQVYALEHTGVFYGTQLVDTLASVDYRMDIDEDYNKTAFNFAKMGEKVVPTGSDATKIDIAFGNMTQTKFEYNTQDEKYYKFFSSNPHIDGNSGIQLAFDNVFILETTIGYLEDGYRRSVDWSGGENSVGYYISKGKIQKIHWSKESEYSPMIFTDESGNELTVNRGKSYITFNYFDSFTFE